MATYDQQISVKLSDTTDAPVIAAINRMDGRTLSERVRKYLRKSAGIPDEPELTPVPLDRTTTWSRTRAERVEE